MAAAVVDEDEAWLYGDDNSGKENAKVKSNGKRKKDDMEEGQLSGEEEGQEKKDTADSDDSDDDDEDDVQVTIGDIRQWSATDGGSKLFKGSGTYQKPAGVVVSKTGGATKGVDIEQQGTINGVPTYEFDINSIEDKPWRKPGADITDYFNYGFDEESWTVYCDKQKKLRAENGASYSSLSGSSMKKDISNTSSHTSQVATLIGRKAAPPPNRRYYGTIDVIGSTATNTRRPTETGTAISTITVTGGATEYNPAVPPPGMAPGIPDYSVPPPGLGVPPNLLPPGVTPNVSLPPPNYPPPGFYPPPGTIPTSEPYEERNYTYDPATGTYNFNSAPPTWDSRGSYGGGYNDYSSSRRDRSPVSEDEYSMSSHRERDRGSSYYRERDRERDRDSRSDRDRRDRDRDGERSRDRDRESSRERRHKDDSKHKKRRFKEEKDSDDHHSSSSKHKKSSRSKKRDKEGEESTDDKQTE